MKKVILLLALLIIFNQHCAFSYEDDYRQIYMDMQVPTFSYIHGLDPGQYYDNKNASYTVYPLFRLAAPLFFKTITVIPGYYELTPRAYKGEYYLLIKDCGAVKYTIPIYKKELVPEGFYDAHIAKPKFTRMQKMHNDFYSWVGTHCKNSQRKPAVQTYLEVNELDNNFVCIIVYYGSYRYYTLFRTVQM